MSLDARQKWLFNGKVNAIYERAAAMKNPPQEMNASEAMKLLRAAGLTFSQCGDIMRSSKYAAHARATGFPLCAMPFGKTEADPPAPKKPSFWRPPL